MNSTVDFFGVTVTKHNLVTILVVVSILLPAYLTFHYDIYGSINPVDTINAASVTPTNSAAAFTQIWNQGLPFIVAFFGLYVRRYKSTFLGVSNTNVVYILGAVAWFITAVLRPASGGTLLIPSNPGVESAYKYVAGGVAAGSLFAIPCVYFS